MQLTKTNLITENNVTNVSTWSGKSAESFSQILKSDKCRTTNASRKQSNHYSRVNQWNMEQWIDTKMIWQSN